MLKSVDSVVVVVLSLFSVVVVFVSKDIEGVIFVSHQILVGSIVQKMRRGVSIEDILAIPFGPSSFVLWRENHCSAVQYSTSFCPVLALCNVLTIIETSVHFAKTQSTINSIK